MTRRKSILPMAAAAFLTVSLAGCGIPDEEDPANADVAVHIHGAGATFPEPLYQRWIEKYREDHADIRIDYEGVGSGMGVKRFIAGEVDFGASDAAMSDAEIAQVERGVRLIPATAGMVVLAYNVPGVAEGLRLPRDVYVDIFRGKITDWSDPRILAANPGLSLPKKSLQRVVRRDSSGTTFAFTNHLSAVSDDWQEELGTAKLLDWPKAITGIGNEGVAQKVNITEGAIGYMEYGFARRLGLPVAALENKAGEFVMPTAASGRDALANAAPSLPQDLRLYLPDPEGAASYPIVSLSWILLYGSYDEAAKAQAIREALTAGLTDGQEIAEEMGYIPLPDVIASRAVEAVASTR